jgi:hypothetical protein
LLIASKSDAGWSRKIIAGPFDREHLERALLEAGCHPHLDPPWLQSFIQAAKLHLSVDHCLPRDE